jgi:hypothetical protein
MQNKEIRDSILYARIQKKNMEFILGMKEKKGFKSLSEFMDRHISSLRNRKADPLDSRKK